MFRPKPNLGQPLNPYHPLSHSLKGAWLFNEQAGPKVRDHSGYGHHGTVTKGGSNSGYVWNAGPGGMGLDLWGYDSNQYEYIDCGEIPDPFNGGSNNLTIAMFLMLEDRAVVNDVGLFSLGSITESWRAVLTRSGGFSIRFTTPGKKDYNFAHQVSENVPEFLVFTLADSYDVSLFVDGAHSQTVAGSAAPRTPAGDFCIGLAAGAYFGGDIYAFYMWDRVLDVSEIAGLYRDPYAMFARPTRWPYWVQGAGGTTYQGAASDGISAGDTLAVLATLLPFAADGVNLSDSLTAVAGFQADASDGLDASDTPSRVMQASRLAVDGLLISDVSSISVTFSPTIADVIKVADSPSTTVTFLAEVTDGFSLSELLITGSAIQAYAVDGLLAGDLSGVLATFQGAASDNLVATDSSSTLVMFTGSILDGLTISDSPSTGAVSSGWGQLYCKSDGRLYFLDGFNVEHKIAFE